MEARPIETSRVLADVRYEIRGQLAHRAHELERLGYEIISLNFGIPGMFGFRTPETMRLAMIENLAQAEPYSHQKAPMGTMYAFIRMDERFVGKLDDRAFALELLENKHVPVAPGSSFNTAYSDHFRITNLPDPEQLHDVFARIDSLLGQHA